MVSVFVTEFGAYAVIIYLVIYLKVYDEIYYDSISPKFSNKN